MKEHAVEEGEGRDKVQGNRNVIERDKQVLAVCNTLGGKDHRKKQHLAFITRNKSLVHRKN